MVQLTHFLLRTIKEVPAYIVCTAHIYLIFEVIRIYHMTIDSELYFPPIYQLLLSVKLVKSHNFHLSNIKSLQIEAGILWVISQTKRFS